MKQTNLRLKDATRDGFGPAALFSDKADLLRVLQGGKDEACVLGHW